MKHINKSVAEFLISETNGQIFTAQFITKKNELRTMNCRLGVKKHLNGGTLKFSPSSKGLVVVFDVKIQDYRMINLNTLLELRINGKVYHVSK